jgi:oxygen-independent coproporphyrinogen-3 oxidase
LEGKTVDTVYFGGGTPGLLTPEGVERIGLALRESLDVSGVREFTVEMNPESVNSEILSAYHAIGADRVSLGMQSAQAEELNMLGRLHTHEDTKKAVELVKKEGFSRLSLDLMYGLPDQTPAVFLKSLEEAIGLGAEHLSFYCLTLSSEVPLWELRDRIPEDEVLRETYLSASAALERAGFRHYEISNAAREGGESLHNLRYWRGEEYLGIGPGAYSYLDGVRFFMPPDLNSFICGSNPRDRIVEEERIETKEKRLTEYLMLSLRLREGLSWEHLKALSDDGFCRTVREKFLLWERHGLCRVSEEGAFLTPSGFFVSNEIISELI